MNYTKLAELINSNLSSGQFEFSVDELSSKPFVFKAPQDPSCSYFLNFECTLVEKIPLSDGIDKMESILGVKKIISDLIPADVPLLSDISVTKIGVDYIAPSKEIQNVYIDFSFEKNSWDFPIFKFKNLTFRVSVFQPLDSYIVGLTAFGNVNLNNTISLECSIQFPNLSFIATMTNPIDITSVIKSIIPYNFGIEKMNCTSLEIIGNTNGDFYTLYTKITEPWNYDFNYFKVDLTNITLKISKDATKTDLEISGDFKLENITISFKALHINDSDWEFSGATLKVEKIKILDFINFLCNKISIQTPDLELENSVTISNLFFSYKSSTNELLFSTDAGIEKEINIAEHILDLKLSLKVQSSIIDNANSIAIWMESGFVFNDNVFILKAAAERSHQTIGLSWKKLNNPLNILEITNWLISKVQFELPENLQISLDAATIYYNTATKNITLIGHTIDASSVFAVSGMDDNEKEGIIIGLSYDGITQLSDLPIIGKYLKPADFLSFQDPGLIYSTSSYKEIVIPRSSENKVIFPCNNLSSLGKGVSALATIKLNESNNIALKNLSTILSLDTLFVQIIYNDKDKNVVLKSTLNGVITLPILGLIISNPEVTITIGVTVDVQFSGELSFEIFSKQLDTKVCFSINETSVSASGEINSDIPSPPGLQGLKLHTANFEMGENFVPPSVLFGIDGEFTIGNTKQKNNDFAIVLQVAEGVVIPQYFSCYINDFSIPQLVTLFTGKDISGFPDGIELKEASLYWCPPESKSLLLPDGTQAYPGLGFRGYLDIFGFKMYGNYKISDSGITGNAQMNPVNLLKVIKIEGNGEAIIQKEIEGKRIDNTKIIQNYNTKPIATTLVEGRGAILEFSSNTSPYFKLNILVSLFDACNIKTDALINNSGIQFQFNFSVNPISKMNLSCNLKDISTFEATGQFTFGLNQNIGPIKVSDIDCGSISLNVNIDTELHINVESERFNLVLNSTFKFEGMLLTIPTVEIKTKPPTSFGSIITELVNELINDASNIFSFIFNKAADWANYVAKGVITGVEDMSSVLKNAYKQTAKEATAIMKNIEKPIDEVARGLKNVYQLVDSDMASVMKGAGYGVNEVGTALKEVYGLKGDAATIVLKGVGYSAQEISDALKSVFKFSSNLAAKALKGAGFAANTVGDVLKSTFKLSTKDAGKVLEGVGYATNDIKNWGGNAIDWIGSGVKKIFKGW